jgi:glucose-1-phosphate thymidylyltransferase
MKALILSGGKGTRLYPFTFTQAKQLIPLANKPVLFYVIEAVLAASIFDIGIVVGDKGSEIEKTVGDGSSFGTNVHIYYIHQAQPLGLAHAVKTAQSFLGDDRFVLFLGDNFIEENIHAWVEQFSSPNNTAHAGLVLKWVPNPQDFGIAHLSVKNKRIISPTPLLARTTDACIVGVEEKPRIPASQWAIVGIYFFDRSIFEAIDAIHPAPNGELEITDAIQYLIEHQYVVQPHILNGYWIDTGKTQDLLAANRIVLNKLQRKIAESAHIDEMSHIYGEVVIGEHVHIQNTIVHGPTIIGTYAELSNAYIGPFTSIGCHTRIEQSAIEQSIIMEGCHMSDIQSKIKNSLCGRHVWVHGSAAELKTYQLLLGDRCNVGLI